MTVQDIKQLQANIAGLNSIVDELRKKQLYANEQYNKFVKGLTDAEKLLPINIAKMRELSRNVQQYGQQIRTNEAALRSQKKALSDATHEYEKNERAVKNNASANKGFVGVLVQMELSIRRIQGGFERIQKAAMFANNPALQWNDFRVMAEAIGESARQLDALDKSARKFNVSKGEVSNWANDIKTELVGLSFGEYGGRLGKAMQRYGLNLSGHEDATGVLAEFRRVALSLPKNLLPLFMKDMGISANFFKWLTHGTDEDFFKNIKENNLAEEMLEKLNSNSEEITRQVGRNQVQEETIAQTVVAEVSKPTEYINEFKSELNKALLEHPTILAMKPLMEGIAGLGGIAFGAKGLFDLLSKAGLSASVKGAGAMAGAGTAATAGGATATLGPIASIAIGITVLAAGWWAITSIAEYFQDKARGRGENETDEQATARENRELEAMQNGFFTQEEIDDKKREIAENRAKRKKNRELIEAQNKLIEKMKTELLSDSEWDILAKKTGVIDVDKQITDKLGGVGDESYNSGRRNVLALKVKNLAQVEAARPHENFITQKVVAFENGRNFRNLLDLFKAENAGKLGDKNQQEALLHYFDKALYPAEVKQFKKFVEDPMDGYMIPSTIRHGAEDLEGYHSEPVLVGGEWQTDSTRANQEKKDALDRILAVEEQERYGKEFHDRLERLQKEAKERERKLSKPLDDIKRDSEDFKKPLSAIESVNKAADDAQTPGGVVNPNAGTTNATTNIKNERPITVKNSTEVKVVQNIGSSAEAGDAFASVQDRVNAINMDDISKKIAQAIQMQLDDVGVAYAPVMG